MSATLETLYTYLGWIPLGYIFFTDLIDCILFFMDQAKFRDKAIKCLMEISLLNPQGDTEEET